MLSDKKQSAKGAVIHEWSYLMLEIENRPNMEVNYEYLLYLESKWKILKVWFCMWFSILILEISKFMYS